MDWIGTPHPNSYAEALTSNMKILRGISFREGHKWGPHDGISAFKANDTREPASILSLCHLRIKRDSSHLVSQE